jgi:aconitate hydratase 2/2-methylisocitrate dehydratase
VKATFLTAIVKGDQTCDVIDKKHAIYLLGGMQGGYNVATLVDALDIPEVGDAAAEQLSNILLVYDAFNDVEEKMKAGNEAAQKVMQNWVDATWFLTRPTVREEIDCFVFKVPGETNTDDLSPAPDAWSRPDIPLHGLAMYKIPRDGVDNFQEQMKDLQKQALEEGIEVALVGDVMGTGSSRKSGCNSVQWFIGKDVPMAPNKRTAGVIIGATIAPIFYNTAQDAGALPLEMDVSQINHGDRIQVRPYEGVIIRDGQKVVDFEVRSPMLFDEVRAGGRIPLIIGRGLTNRARAALGMKGSNEFVSPAVVEGTTGYSLAQKMVGVACGLDGVYPGQYCEPLMTTVGSQDTTGPMTRDELKDLACLGFSADLVMQSFCHTAAYPKPVDVVMHAQLPDFIRTRGGVPLRPGDGIIHSWLNRMLLPDTVGTGGDSHTRFPIGISFPGGSGLVAFAAAAGVMPLIMPQSVLVRFHGEMQPGITLRDLVHAIPFYAIKRGLLTVPKKNKKNIFAGTVLELEGLSTLKVEQAFELSDASAERSAAGCAVKLDEAPVKEYLTSNIVMLRWMISEGYGDVKTLKRRISKMEEWLEKPKLMSADKDAQYLEIIDINLEEIHEPILCCPNDPDDAQTLSDHSGTKVDEVFIGSCMTNIGHFRAAGKLLQASGKPAAAKLWVSPPTKMDEKVLIEEGYFSIFEAAGVRIEIPGCSLCMGNQARVAPKATVLSTSTRNFPNRLGTGANVFLSSAEVATVAAMLGRIPTKEEYMEYASEIKTWAEDAYRYLNFHEIQAFVQAAESVKSGGEFGIKNANDAEWIAKYKTSKNEKQSHFG